MCTRKLPGSRGWQGRSSPSMTLPTPASTRFFATCTRSWQVQGQAAWRGVGGSAVAAAAAARTTCALGGTPPVRRCQCWRHAHTHLCPQSTASEHEDLGTAQPAAARGGRAALEQAPPPQHCRRAIQACGVLPGTLHQRNTDLFCVSTPQMRSWRSYTAASRSDRVPSPAMTAAEWHTSRQPSSVSAPLFLPADLQMHSTSHSAGKILGCTALRLCT